MTAIGNGKTITIGGTQYTIDSTVSATNGINGTNLTTNAAIAKIKEAIIQANGIGATANKVTGSSTDEGLITVDLAKIQTKNDLTLSLHVGADSDADNKISFNIETMDSEGLGIKGIKVTGNDPSNATYAIDNIAEAIKKVSKQRSGLGAIQNRLEHTINNLNNVVENTTSAESAIRDTDMASEMVKYSNNSILTQAGQAMLAQANQSNQGVLSLLQ